MPFIHDPLPQVEITATTTESGRVYDTPDGRYESVTTVIGRVKDQRPLIAWRKRVGEAEANRITRQAGIRGTAVHRLAEDYLNNQPDWSRGAMPSYVATFNDIRSYLDRHLGIIRAIEMPLWSKRLRTAGRTDLIGEWDGELSIIDFKTSRRIKTAEHCFGYFVQEACYAIMLYERLGILPRQIVTIMAVDHERPILFVKKRSDFDQHVKRIFVTDRLQPKTLT